MAIIGSGDSIIAQSLINRVSGIVDPDDINDPRFGMSDAFKQTVYAYQDRCQAVVKQNLGCVAGTIFHHNHGKSVNRRYLDRNQIIIKNQYDPSRDLVANAYDVWEWHPHCSQALRDDTFSYFIGRKDDE